METKRHLTPEDSIIQSRLSSSRIKTCLKEEPEINSLVDVHNIDISVKQEDCKIFLVLKEYLRN
jgi:hypothetical protein